MIRTFFAGAFLALIALTAIGVVDIGIADAEIDLPTISVEN
jgi:hypothetical protein